AARPRRGRGSGGPGATGHAPHARDPRPARGRQPEGPEPFHRITDPPVPRARRGSGSSPGGGLGAARPPRPGDAPLRRPLPFLRRPGAGALADGATAGRGGGARRAGGTGVGAAREARLAQARAAFTPDSNASTSAVTGAEASSPGTSNGARPSCFVPSEGKNGESR